MIEREELCSCVGSAVGAGDNRPTVCPKCDKRIAGPKQFSDIMLEATHEILAEEGVIWAGAR